MNPNVAKHLEKYSKEVQRQALTKVIADRYRKSLYLTAKDLLQYTDITHFTHDETIAALESPTKRKLICLPRGTFKSSISVVSYSIWLLLNDPNLRILIDSEIYDNSKNFIREIRQKLDLPRVVQLFGESRGDQWAEGSITVKQRTKILKESSVTASGVGANKVGAHFNVIIHDDMNTDRNSQTKEQRQKVINHYRMNISILEPNGIIVIIGTRYSSDDLLGHVLETEIHPKGLLPGV